MTHAAQGGLQQHSVGSDYPWTAVGITHPDAFGDFETRWYAANLTTGEASPVYENQYAAARYIYWRKLGAGAEGTRDLLSPAEAVYLDKTWVENEWTPTPVVERPVGLDGEVERPVGLDGQHPLDSRPHSDTGGHTDGIDVLLRKFGDEALPMALAFLTRTTDRESWVRAARLVREHGEESDVFVFAESVLERLENPAASDVLRTLLS